MKTFKNTREFKYLFILLAFAIAALSSCSKVNDDNVSASPAAYVMVTNAAEGSAPQDFYLNSAKTATPTAYGSSTAYLAANAGTYTGQFTDAGSANVNASFSLTLQASQYYSVYYTGAPSATASNYVVTQDDLTAPATGKAKVRFVHLSSAAAASVDFGISATNKLVTGLAYKAASAYYSVDAATTFALFASGSTSVALSIPVTIQAGKIYTIYISGATAATISYHIVAQN